MANHDTHDNSARDTSVHDTSVRDTSAQDTTTHEFLQLDVFSTGPFSGNPLAVINDADDLSDQQMQNIARWTGLSETAFLCSPDNASNADYKVRIFSPDRELPFAGHPTLGAAFAWREFNGRESHDKAEITQQCQAGIVTVREEDGKLYFAAPELRRTGPLDDNTIGTIVRALGISHYDIIDHAWGDNGPGWALIQLKNADAVRRIKARTHGHVNMAIFGFEEAVTHKDVEPLVGATDEEFVADAGHAAEGEAILEVRAVHGSHEDPVTGSANAAIAQFLHAKNAVPKRYRAKQGSRIGFNGEIDVNIDSEIWVGGTVTRIIRGSIEI